MNGKLKQVTKTLYQEQSREVDSESHNTNTAITCKINIPKLNCSTEELHDVMISEPAMPSEKIYCKRGSRNFCQRQPAKRHLNDGPTMNAGLKALWTFDGDLKQEIYEKKTIVVKAKKGLS